METPPQVDSKQKSPVTKTPPPTDNKDSRSPPESNSTESKSPAGDHSDSKDSSKHQETPEKQSCNASNAVDTLSHPIISVDIQKGKPCDSKQADKTPDVPPEVIASVVTTAIVNEASLTVEESDGLVINGSKVSSDSSKVDMVVKNELDKLSEAMDGKTELKNENTVIQDAKPLPNGHIDQSPNDEAVTTRDVLIKDTKATANVDGKDSGVTQKILTTETSNKTEAKACADVDKNSNVETESCNGVPGIITVTTISKKDSNREASEVSGSEKHSNLTNCILEEDKPVNRDGTTDVQEVIAKPTECPNKHVDNSKVVGKSNLTDSAKLNSNQSVTGTDAKTEKNDDSNAKQNEKNKVSDASADKEHGKKEANDRSLGNEPNDKESAAQEIISSSTEKVPHCDIPASKGSVSGDKSDTSPKGGPQKTTREITESEMNMMMTSQILTEEDLNGPEVESSDPDHDCSKSADGTVLESCRISATRYSPDKCDVGVGLDERAGSSIRVASGGGGEEEVDGQEATAEVDMTDDPGADATSTSSMPGAASPASQATPTKISSTISLSSAAASHKDDESRTASAASRSSIPDAIVYEPPERRRSAVSEAKKSIEKSQEDEKETEKVDTLTEETRAESAGTEQKTDDPDAKSEQELTEEKGEGKDELELSDKDTDSNIKETDETESLTKEDGGSTKADHEEADAEKEKGVEDEKETERTESKCETQGDDPESESKKDKDSPMPSEEVEALPEKTEGLQQVKDDASSNANPPEAAEGEIVADVATEKEVVEDATESKENETAGDSATNKEEVKDSAAELTVAEVHSDGNAAENETDAGVEKEAGESEEMPRELEEPKTLVGEEEVSDVKDGVVEAKDEDEKEEADEVKEEEGKRGEEIEVNQGEETMKNGGKEVESVEENQTEDTAETEEAGDAKEDAEKNEDEDEAKLEKPDADNEAAEGEATDGKHVEGEDEEDGEKPEPPPRSPTKRMRSPDKAGRRGISPISSPPKQLKTPPSPQKPQKTTSPKKKNGTLSPIKTPKTPGSDTRKLPPIKAPVGLAPNPNLKNIRSKIGSFDNIKYKPGGGDKKVISKKLEWKAAPKIGSLDHSYKGEKKHSKSQSKGETKDEKQADGQSPAVSGDEAEGPATAEISETLLKQESSEMPVAIAAES